MRTKLTSRSDPLNYPLAKKIVDGLQVRDSVPNMGSIAASLNEYRVLTEIRSVPLADFDQVHFYAANDLRWGHELAKKIEASGEINPLIVVVEENAPRSDRSPYVLEGGHRLFSLQLLSKTEFPALIVIDESNEE